MHTDNQIQAAGLLNKLVAQHKTPGLQYLLMQGDQLIFEHTAGMADFEKARSVTKDSFFNVCSVTKTFTSLAVLQLIEKGKLKLTDQAADFISGFRYREMITIQQLLSHTSGISNPIPLKWVHLQEEDKSFNEDAFFDTVFSRHTKLKSVPGSKFAYSNLNYLLLGRVIENISGLSYRDYIRQHIIDKLQIHTNPLGFAVPDDLHYARGYQKRFTIINLLLGFMLDRKKFMEPSADRKWVTFKKYYVSGRAFGGLLANAYSLASFMHSLFSKNAVLLGETYQNLLLNPQHISDGKKINMTMGWFTGKLGNEGYITHAGGGGGYYCEMRYYPATGMSSVIMFNRSGIRDERLLDKVDCYFYAGQGKAGTAIDI